MPRSIFYQPAANNRDTDPWTRVTGAPPFDIAGLTNGTEYRFDDGQAIYLRTPEPPTAAAVAFNEVSTFAYIGGNNMTETAISVALEDYGEGDLLLVCRQTSGAPDLFDAFLGNTPFSDGSLETLDLGGRRGVIFAHRLGAGDLAETEVKFTTANETHHGGYAVAFVVRDGVVLASATSVSAGGGTNNMAAGASADISISANSTDARSGALAFGFGSRSGEWTLELLAPPGQAFLHDGSNGATYGWAYEIGSGLYTATQRWTNTDSEPVSMRQGLILLIVGQAE